MVRKELKQYVVYPPPWQNNQGDGCVDPSYGIPESFVKDQIKIKVSFSDFCKKFEPKKANPECDVFADILSFISQDGLIFYLFGVPEGDQTIIWQVYFDDNYRYPPNIKDARKETTAFKRWLLKQI